ncbi:Asp23/Gls24 family envelope stress response protein [Pseudonocardiaceae bacterium YIM PH 21723]|nr:Asp23/Gls24 family envelope stress response protein [Pseudonocardiaceae bacterium YIM PH 21723]
MTAAQRPRTTVKKPPAQEPAVELTAEQWVQQIAGTAARQTPGVIDLGDTATRAFGVLRQRITGSARAMSDGVSVEVGDREAAIDLQVVLQYGVNLTDLANLVRTNVSAAVEKATGLRVIEANVEVLDIQHAG